MPSLNAYGDPIPSTPPMHGLQASATEVQTPNRWELGAAFCPENCVEIAGFDPECASWPEGDKPELSTAAAPLGCYDVLPFALESPFKCDAGGFQTLDFAGRARRQLEAGTSKGLEHELWTATLKPGNASLDNGATVVGAGAVGILSGLALLGAALAGCAHGGRGMIHAPSFIVDLWLGLYGMAFRVEGNRIVTVNRGDVIVSGSGYPGTGEDGLAISTGQAWVYATGPVQYRLGEVMVFPETLKEAMDRKKNDVEYRAERMAMINFDPCCHFGVLIDTDVPPVS